MADSRALLDDPLARIGGALLLWPKKKRWLFFWLVSALLPNSPPPCLMRGEAGPKTVGEVLA